MKNTFRYNLLIVVACAVIWQRKLSNKRGPPVLPNRLQKKGNASNILSEVKAADIKKEGEEERVIR